jgi:hypothetical protein
MKFFLAKLAGGSPQVSGEKLPIGVDPLGSMGLYLY